MMGWFTTLDVVLACVALGVLGGGCATLLLTARSVGRRVAVAHAAALGQTAPALATQPGGGGAVARAASTKPAP